MGTKYRKSRLLSKAERQELEMKISEFEEMHPLAANVAVEFDMEFAQVELRMNEVLYGESGINRQVLEFYGLSWPQQKGDMRRCLRRSGLQDAHRKWRRKKRQKARKEAEKRWRMSQTLAAVQNANKTDLISSEEREALDALLLAVKSKGQKTARRTKWNRAQFQAENDHLWTPVSGSACTYCRSKAVLLDHVPSLYSVWQGKAQPGYKVPACWDCNSKLGACASTSIFDRMVILYGYRKEFEYMREIQVDEYAEAVAFHHD